MACSVGQYYNSVPQKEDCVIIILFDVEFQTTKN